ncbi:phosphate ABC transporter substrate-binding protein PstS [Novosphingobium sp.]|uniref:phosphate ABC transporter substrate-binding protein PstS n=1 Tax=Novosphingobium sp. TaxID=1874826 RepID=UPI0025DB111D|nr:phosphate ABC transporter substrate-binding protein PstS [Novosphingobium sp.]
MFAKVLNRPVFASVIAGVAAATLSACSGQPGASGGSGISGAGASFPAPLYTKWASAFNQAGLGKVNYQSIGSGGGIKQIKSSTVDFGATDKPLKLDDLNASGLLQFPAVIGGVVPVVNLAGVKSGEVHLTGKILGEIFLGKIKTWNAPEIAALNGGVKLPATPITVVHRSDGSGTSFLFTTYLTAADPDWAKAVGASDSVSWPVGLGGKGNDGVAAFVKQTAGSIGYVEYAFAKQNNLTTTLVQNKAGKFPEPTAAAFSAAGASAPWTTAPGNAVLLIDQPGEATWPISAVTFILVHKAPANPEKVAATLKFFDWAFKNGDEMAAKLDFVPLPEAVKTMVREQWSQVQAGGKPVYTPK